MTETQNAQLHSSGRPPQPGAHSRLEFALLALLVCTAFAMRVYRLGTFPDTVLADEADNAQSAISILLGHPPQNGFFGVDWTPQPAMSVYKEAGALAIFGFTVQAMRLPSALFSALALVPFYLLLRRQFSILAATLASILLATDVWYLNFSRSGWNNVDVCLYVLLSMLFLMLALDSLGTATERPWRTRGYFAAAGFSCALGLYAYPAGRASTIAVIAFFPVAWLAYRKYFRVLLAGYALLFLVEAIAFAPEAAYVVKHWEQFNGRTQVVAIFNSPEFKADPAGTMLLQLSRNVRSPWDGRVNNTPRYSPVGEPQLDRLTGILVALGMVLSMAIPGVRRRAETWLWWLMLLAGWGMTQLITVSTPDGARGIGAVPLLIYFSAVPLDLLLRGTVQLSARTAHPLVVTGLARGITAIAIVAAGYFNVAHYVDWQSSPGARQARYLYVTVTEFPQWSAEIVSRITNNRGGMNVGQWRELYPIQNVADPYSTSP